MDLLPSTEQEQILDSMRGFLADSASVDRLREHGAIGNPDAKLWPALGQLGFIGLSLEEAAGGVGLSSAEEMLVFREYGRHLIALGVFGLVLGARIAADAGDTELRDTLLTGTVNVGIANPRGPVTISAQGISGAFHLFEAATASLILVLGDDGAALVSREDFTEVAEAPATDATLGLERATADGIVPRLWISADADPITRRAVLLLSAYAVGIGEGARDMAVDYAKVREQFGKPIGSFQAIKHICADMAMRSEAALCQASFAALVFAEGRADSPFHVTASKIVATDTALKNSAASIQVHGAFGFTSEANAHHYLKRAHVADLLWGDIKTHRERLLDMPTPA